MVIKDTVTRRMTGTPIGINKFKFLRGYTLRPGAWAPAFFYTSPLNPLSWRRGGGEWGVLKFEKVAVQNYCGTPMAAAVLSS